MHSKLNDSPETHSRKTVRNIQEEIFQYLRAKHEAIDLCIGQESKQSIHCVVVHSRLGYFQARENYFVGHGFGGSSLMNFAVIEPLLQKGNVILWQVRGMGVSQRLEKYQVNSLECIQLFFLETITSLLSHFQPKNATFICHSFSAYITFKFLIKNPFLSRQHIKEVLLLSPVGITPPEHDYKNYINSCSDFFYSLLSKFGWTFKVTYKSLLRTVCSCLKSYFVEKYLRQIELSQQGKQLMTKLLSLLIDLDDGSDLLFFQYFHPRVLPKVALEPLLVDDPAVKVTMVFGGEADWVDKEGPCRLASRYPESIKVLRLQKCGHNIFFQTSECLNLFDQLFK